jgi:Phage Tail Collar Domain
MIINHLSIKLLNYKMKKFYLLLLFIVLAHTVLTAQQNYLPFQGRLMFNGTAVNTPQNFKFSINSGNLVWQESFNNVPVYSGIYAVVLGTITPLPSNLFGASATLPLVVSVNNTPIDTVNIYAPIERDPTLPAYLRDGVSWSEITDRPVVDPQQLQLTGNTLAISRGNSVILPASSGGGRITSDSLWVGNRDTSVQVPINQTVQTSSSSNICYIYQSFVASNRFTLKSITVRLANLNSNNLRFDLYASAFPNTQAILNPLIVNNVGAAFNNYTFVLSQPIELVAGASYAFTIQTTPCNCSAANCGFVVAKNDNNPYPFGQIGYDNQTQIASNQDLVFSINADLYRDYLLSVTDAATIFRSATLNAPNARITDKTGEVSPVGIVSAFAGVTPPRGWLLCDGRAVSRLQYPDLFATIGVSHGQGDSVLTFNLPDYRGLFLRGVSGTSVNDPDKLTRLPMNHGGNAGNAVGSTQMDLVGSHDHFDRWLNVLNPQGINGYVGALGILGNNAGSKTAPNIGSETRGKNAYVNYIIRY